MPRNEWQKIFATYVTDKTLYPEYVKSSCKTITEQQETEEKNRQDTGQLFAKRNPKRPSGSGECVQPRGKQGGVR